MSELVCAPAPRGSWAAQYDRFSANGTAGADGVIQAADAQAWVAATGDWAPGKAAALLRWPQLHCSLFRLAAIQSGAADSIVNDYANQDPNASDLQLMEQRLEAKQRLHDVEMRLRGALGWELHELLDTPDMRKNCSEDQIRMWQAVLSLEQKVPPDAITDLCAAALYYLGSFAREQMAMLSTVPLAMEASRFAVLDAEAARLAGTAGSVVAKSVGAPAVLRLPHPPFTDGAVQPDGADEVEVFAINGVTTLPLSAADCERALVGEIGSTARLTVRLPGTGLQELFVSRHARPE